MKNNFSPKEITIFNGVLKLAREGADVSKITSQQIAAAAGVGKATIYDYFSSKEEIVMGALMYSMSDQAAQFAQAMDNTPDFRDKMEIIYTGIIGRVQDTGSIFHLLLQVTGGFKNSADNICQPLKEQIMEFAGILYGVLSDGYHQGVLKTDVTAAENHQYVRMVFISNVFGVASRAKDKNLSVSHRQIIDNAYRMLVKSLA